MKIEHYYYQGDMTAFINTFAQFHKILKVSPEYYNYKSISLLTDMFSNKDILESLLEIRELIANLKIVEGELLNQFLNQSYIRDYK